MANSRRRKAYWRSPRVRWRARERPGAGGRDDCARQNRANGAQAHQASARRQSRARSRSRPTYRLVARPVRGGRRLRRWRGRVCGFVGPVPREAKSRLSGGTWRRTKGEPAHARSSGRSRAAAVQGAILPIGLLEGALKGVAAAVGHCRAISMGWSARRGAWGAGRRPRL